MFPSLFRSTTMLSLLKKSMAVAVALQAVTALATPISNEVGIEKRGSGFANAVYFTNWFVRLFILQLSSTLD